MITTSINTVDELQVVIKDSPKVHLVGNGSKTGLHQTNATAIKLTGLIGVTEYEPAEYTITAQASTPVHVIQETLAQNGQYLPFDPILAQSATLGGTVAANLSGSRRFRYGGVRDFILGARVVDGLGRAFRVGGKVVKNSAGFDLTKFLVGSLGQYVAMTEITFKVFPDTPSSATLKLRYDSLDDLLKAIYFINQSVFELDALDFEPDSQSWVLWARIAGLSNTLDNRVQRLTNALNKHTELKDTSHTIDEDTIWQALNGMTWADAGAIVKVALSPKHIPVLDKLLSTINIQRRYSVGGNIAWIATDDTDALHQHLVEQDLTGLVILGNSSQPILGKQIDNVLSERVKQIVDPENKFV